MRTYTTVTSFKGFPAGFEFKWDGQNYIASKKSFNANDNGESYDSYELAYSPSYMEHLAKQGYVTCGNGEASPELRKRENGFNDANKAIALATKRFLSPGILNVEKFDINTIAKLGIREGFDVMMNNAEDRFKERVIDIISSRIKPADLNLDNVANWTSSVFGNVVEESIRLTQNKDIHFTKGSSVKDFVNAGIALIVHELTLKLIGKFTDLVAIAANEVAHAKSVNDSGNTCGVGQQEPPRG
jgi:hypothetical protein